MSRSRTDAYVHSVDEFYKTYRSRRDLPFFTIVNIWDRNGMCMMLSPYRGWHSVSLKNVSGVDEWGLRKDG